MIKIKASLAFLAIFALAASAQGDLWRADIELFPSLQVKTPGALFCWAQEGEPTAVDNYQSICYDATGGWWFGYGFGSNAGDVKDATTGKSLVPKAAMQLTEDEGNPEPGSGLSPDLGSISVRYEPKNGTANDPSGAGIGFNWHELSGMDYSGTKIENINSFGGLCITYKSTGDVIVELGIDEMDGKGPLGDAVYDTWTVKLSASSDWKAQAMPWSLFMQVGWSPDKFSLDHVLTNAESVKFKVENKTTDPQPTTFQICQIGKGSTCNTSCAAGQLSIPGGAPQLNASKFVLNGRNLSLVNANAPAAVQIINMQGAVVAQKTLSGEPLNLANMPAGIYMVRSVSLGISQKIVLK